MYIKNARKSKKLKNKLEQSFQKSRKKKKNMYTTNNKPNSVFPLWKIFPRVYGTAIVVPLFNMWSTGDCVQYVVYTLHPLRKSHLTSRCTKSANKRKWLPTTIRSTSKAAAYCCRTSDRVFMCIPVPGIGVGGLWWRWYWGIYYTWSFVYWTRDSCYRAPRVVLDRGVKTKHPVLYSVACF